MVERVTFQVFIYQVQVSNLDNFALFYFIPSQI